MSAVIDSLLTIDEFLALPEDGTDRELIRGELREQPMTVRNRFHSEATSTLSWLLKNWAQGQPQPPHVVGGEAGFILGAEQSVVGIDVAVVSAETIELQTDETSLIDGLPQLAIEILSPSDTVEAIHEKEQLYLDCGVPLVWIVDPLDHTVKVLEPGQPPRLFNERDTLAAEQLPGLAIPVREVFGIK
jgi:Uma2 family endonuclease